MPRGRKLLLGDLEVPEDGGSPSATAAVRRRQDIDRRLTKVPGTLSRDRNDRDGPVALHRVVEQAQRIRDHPSIEIVVQRQGVSAQRGRTLDRVLTLRDTDF